MNRRRDTLTRLFFFGGRLFLGFEHLKTIDCCVLKHCGTASGELCQEDLSLLVGWSAGELNMTWSSMLAPEGKLELEGLASRHKSSLPALLDQPFSNTSFQVKSLLPDQSLTLTIMFLYQRLFQRSFIILYYCHM